MFLPISFTALCKGYVTYCCYSCAFGLTMGAISCFSGRIERLTLFGTNVNEPWKSLLIIGFSGYFCATFPFSLLLVNFQKKID